MTLQKYIVMARAYCGCERGAAAAELALVVTLLTIPLLNVIDLGTYAFRRMQVDNAAQTGADQVRSLCNTPTQLPATSTSKCNLTNTIVTNYIQNTSLGTSVTLASASPVLEGYYCTLTNGTLQLVGTSGTPGSPPAPPTPNTCDAVTGHSAANGTAPSDFIRITVHYTFTPVFAGLSVTSLLPTNINQVGWSRLQ